MFVCLFFYTFAIRHFKTVISISRYKAHRCSSPIIKSIYFLFLLWTNAYHSNQKYHYENMIDIFILEHMTQRIIVNHVGSFLMVYIFLNNYYYYKVAYKIYVWRYHIAAEVCFIVQTLYQDINQFSPLISICQSWRRNLTVIVNFNCVRVNFSVLDRKLSFSIQLYMLQAKCMIC